ncbi:MAG TPA: hemolysin family protein [Pyrinomonadaceae bacterium]|nr:hemolysin family protein [Pyrinomonadaceae bacterium]
MEIEIVVGAAILLALVVLATVDLAFAQLSDLSLRRLSSESDATLNERSTRLLRTIVEDRARFRFALSSTIQFLLIAFTVLLTWVLLNTVIEPRWVLLWALVIGLFVTVVFRQIIPRLFVRNRPERSLLFLLPIVRPLYAVATVLTSPISGFFKRRESQKLDQTQAPDAADDDDEDLQALMEVGEAEGILEEDEREMIESMFEFSETRTGEIMTPRTEICAISYDSTVKQARDLMVEEKYSRLPAYRESIDNIEGILYVRDLLQAWAEGKEDAPVSDVLRDAYFVPETKPAAELLKSMQTNHFQFAVVIDEYGGVAGIVTVEDILEEIVGEIEDEDIEEEEIIEIVEGDEGYWDVLGSTEIDKIERLFDIELEKLESTTIAGMITSEAGYVPKTGDKLSFMGLDIEILRADEKKVYLVRLRRSILVSEALSE